MHSNFIALAALASFPLAAASTANAQALLHDVPGTTSGDLLGTDVANVGDFDHDGVDDFAIGIPRVETPLVDAGRVEVRSGATGLVLRSWNGPITRAQFGCSLAAAGDLDQDGTPDVFVGMFTWGTSPSLETGAVLAISGASGATLFQVQGTQHAEWFGTRVAAIGDTDGDGRSELAVSSTRYDEDGGERGRVRVFSGLDGSLRFTLLGRMGNASFGSSLAPAGDVDADGVPDVLIGSEGDSGGGDRTGLVLVVRGSDGATLRTIEGDQPIMLLGRSVAGAGDVDGDGRADFLAGAPLFDVPGAEDAGVVRLYSGASGAVLRTWTGATTWERYGLGLAAGADIDLDGTPDVMIGCKQGPALPGRVRMVSGASGAPIFTVTGLTPDDALGEAVAWLGDLDGDGRPEFAAGAPNDDPGGNVSGRARVWRACTPVTPYCVGKVNSLGCTPSMSSVGTPSLAGPDDFAVRATNVINQSVGMVIWSRQPNSTPFGGGTLCLLPPLRRTPIVSAGGMPASFDDCSGVINFPFTHAYAVAQGFAPGDLVHCQVWARDAASPDSTGLSLSNALEFRWCP